MSEVKNIKTLYIAVLAVFVGLFAAQNDSAGSNPVDTQVAEDAGYVYMDFSYDTEGDGLLPYYRDPATRGALISFLEGKVGNPINTVALVEAAERHNLDPALVIALSWQESRFNASAVGHNTNGTYDRGLMQLNSSTFPQLSDEEFFDPFVNARHGTAYLRESLDRAGNTVAALAMYNAGPYRVGVIGAPRSTLDYIHKITTYRNQLIQDFQDSTDGGGILMTRDIKPVKNPDLL